MLDSARLPKRRVHPGWKEGLGCWLLDSTAHEANQRQAEPATLLSKSNAHYWKARLIRRSYTEAIKLIRGQEYSTRIEHGGVSFFFPLGSDDEDRAALRAIQIHSTIANEGWQAACDRIPREITVAVFWGWNPMACTYTTLYSLPAESRTPVARH